MKKILIGSLIVIVIIIVVISIIKLNSSKSGETFVEPRGFGGKMIKTNMLSNAYAGGQKYNPTSLDPSSLRSVVSNTAMANAGTIDTVAQYYNELKRKEKQNEVMNENKDETPAVETATDGLILTQNNIKVDKEPETENEISDEPYKEGFFNTGIESVSVNAMGNLEGPTIYTNGQLGHGLTYDEIVKGVKEGKHVSDHVIAGAGKGDAFEDLYQDYVKIQDKHDMNPTGVRSQEEIDEITKSLNGNTNLAKHNILTRAGAGKMKIKLDPNGTVGVMEDNARLLPERDRNHTIYATSHVVHIPGFELPYMDQYQNVSNGGSGFGGAMSANVSDVVTGIGSNAAKNSKILNDKTNESFSSTF